MAATVVTGQRWQHSGYSGDSDDSGYNGDSDDSGDSELTVLTSVTVTAPVVTMVLWEFWVTIFGLSLKNTWT
jgi:hypothetical protein